MNSAIERIKNEAILKNQQEAIAESIQAEEDMQTDLLTAWNTHIGEKKSIFERCMKIVFANEGGIVDHPDDPGGYTNAGITEKALKKNQRCVIKRRLSCCGHWWKFFIQQI